MTIEAVNDGLYWRLRGWLEFRYNQLQLIPSFRVPATADLKMITTHPILSVHTCDVHNLHHPLNVLLAPGLTWHTRSASLGHDVGVEFDLHDVLPDLTDLQDLHHLLVHVPLVINLL